MPNEQGPRLICRRSSFLHPASRINPFIANHLFNQSIEIVCPVVAGTPHPSLLANPSHIYYYSVRACLSIFLDRSFIESYLQPSSARFYALTVCNQGGGQTAVALGPDGRLCLHLDKEAYAHFGITGNRSKYDDEYYNVEIQLLGKDFRPGRRFYHKVLESLQRVEHAMEFMCCFTVDGQPAEVQIEDLDGVISCHRVQAASVCRREGNCPLPDILSMRHNESLDEREGTKLTHESILAFHEWLGALSSGIHADEISGLLRATHDIIKHCDLKIFTCQGFLGPNQVAECLQQCRAAMRGPSPPPWVAINVWGFTASPVTWTGHKNSMSTTQGGENDYTVVLLPDEEYLLLVSVGRGGGFGKI